MLEYCHIDRQLDISCSSGFLFNTSTVLAVQSTCHKTKSLHFAPGSMYGFHIILRIKQIFACTALDHLVFVIDKRVCFL